MAIYLVLTLLAITSRLVPHPANIAPMSALALFIGTYSQTQATKNKRLVAFGLPLIAMLLSDSLIGFYTWQVMAAVYFSLALTILLGTVVRKYYRWPVVIGASLAGSIIFFLLTNAAVWAFTPMYAKTVHGLIESYTMALPFFRNSLIGDLLYTSCLFGSYSLAYRNRFNNKEAAWLKPLANQALS